MKYLKSVTLRPRVGILDNSDRDAIDAFHSNPDAYKYSNFEFNDSKAGFSVRIIVNSVAQKRTVVFKLKRLDISHRALTVIEKTQEIDTSEEEEFALFISQIQIGAMRWYEAISKTLDELEPA